MVLQRPRLLSLVAVAWSIAVGAWVAYGPVYSRAGSTLSPDGVVTVTAMPARSGLDMIGPRLFLVLLIPVILAAIPAIVPRNRWGKRAGGTAVVLYGVFCLVTGFSIGLLYVPALLALVLSATIPLSSRQ